MKTGTADVQDPRRLRERSFRGQMAAASMGSPRRRAGSLGRYLAGAAAPVSTARVKGRLLLADGHLLLLEGLRSLLGREFEVVGCASHLAGLLHDARRLAPDLVLAGAEMPGADGPRLLARLRSVAPSARVVVLASAGDARLAAEAFRLGARAFVLRSSSLDELRAGLDAALRGERFLTALVADGDPGSLPEGTGSVEGIPGPEDVLTPREREVVRLTAEGRLMKQVGAALGISTRTVAFHKYRAMGKLGARSSAELVRFALRTTLI